MDYGSSPSLSHPYSRIHCSAPQVQPPGAASVAAIWFSPSYLVRYTCSAGPRSWNRALFLANIKPQGDSRVTVTSDTRVRSCSIKTHLSRRELGAGCALRSGHGQNWSLSAAQTDVLVLSFPFRSPRAGSDTLTNTESQNARANGRQQTHIWAKSFLKGAVSDQTVCLSMLSINFYEYQRLFTTT